MRRKNQHVEENEPADEKSKTIQDQYIMRGRMGIILPAKNAFDFTERPVKNTVQAVDRKNANESGRSKL